MILFIGVHLCSSAAILLFFAASHRSRLETEPRVYGETDTSALLLAFPFTVITRVWSPAGSAGT